MSVKFIRRALVLGILLIAVGGTFALVAMKPPPETQDLGTLAPLVEILPLTQSAESFRVASQGTVRPRTETILSAEVSGAIVSISQKFIAGGVFTAGEELMRIDPSNYTVAVDQARALLAQRQIEYDGALQLRTQGYRAESEYASAAAALATARADLTRAERNLERTRISLPYDGMVRAKEADLGQYVNPGTRLGITFATDYAEVRMPLTDQDLAFIDLPDAADISQSGAAVGPQVDLSAVQKGRIAHWSARIVRTEGVVDESNRVTYAVARIEDPYQLSGSGDEPSLPMGTFVAANIQGTTVADLVRIPRSALRGNNQLMFVDDENRLHLAAVDVVRADSQHAYLDFASLPLYRISVTVIESPISGMLVRTSDEPASDADAADDQQLAAGSKPN